MAIKSGELIHVGNQVLVDRAQTAGPGTVNIPTEKIYELGNYNSVATIRDTADLTFTCESFDVSAELEALLLGLNFATLAPGAKLEMGKILPIDVASQFKAGRTNATPYNVVGSVAIPFLTAESLSYRFGIRDNASQSVSLRGDSIFYAEASAYIQEFAAGAPLTLEHPAIPYNGDAVAGTRYALGVSLVSGKRLAFGADYTETVTGTAADGSRAVTLVLTEPIPAGDRLRVIYQSPVIATYPAFNGDGTPTATHAVASAVRPAAIKGRDIEILIGGRAITDRWSSVQSITCEQRLTLEKDEEMGNAQAVAQDFDIPVVTGSVEIKPRDYAELMRRIRQIAGVTGALEAVGPYQTALLPLEIRLHSPESGAVLKTLEVPDARFTLPGFSPSVNTKINVSFPFESDTGVLNVYNGARP